MLTAPSRFSLQDAGIGFILVIDRRQDRWTSVKASILRIAVSVSVVGGPATPMPSPGGGHGLSCPVALWVLAGAALGASWGWAGPAHTSLGSSSGSGTCVCARARVHACPSVCVRVCACTCVQLLCATSLTWVSSQGPCYNLKTVSPAGLCLTLSV